MINQLLNPDEKLREFIDLMSFQTIRKLQLLKDDMEGRTWDETDIDMAELHDILLRLLNTHNIFEWYLDQNQFLRYILIVNDPSHAKIPEKLNDLLLTFKSNFLAWQRNVAINVFYHWGFPYTCLHLKRLESSLQCKQRCKGDLERQISDTLKDVKTVRGGICMFYHNGNAGQEGRFILSAPKQEDHPLFEWKYSDAERIGQNIDRLLNGEMAILFADPSRRPFKHENVNHHGRIEITLKTHNQMDQSNLDEIFKYFKVTLIHTDQSHHPLGHNYYSAYNNQILIEYSVARVSGSTGEYWPFPLSRNSAYARLAENEQKLSVYTYWKMKLEISGDLELPEDEATLRKRLASFAGKVDLQLVGEARFVKSRGIRLFRKCISDHNHQEPHQS